MAMHMLAPRVRDAATKHLEQGGQTPFVVVDLEEAARSYAQFRKMLPRVRPFYAVKANPDRPLLHLLSGLGAGFDVASVGEIASLVDAPPEGGLGIEPERLIYANPVKPPRGVAAALERGVRLFTADCREELDKLERVASQAGLTEPVEVLVRMWVPNFGSVVDLSSKFGADTDEILALFRHARTSCPRLALRGLAFHVGSQCINPANYLKATQLALDALTALRNEGFAPDMLDIGGGFPVNYTLRVSYVEDVLQAVADSLARVPDDVEVIAEPGRTFCATSATLFTTVVGRTERNGRPWYFIDDSIYQTFSGKIYDFIDYEFFPLHAEVHPAMEVTVAGCSCDGHDVISRQALLPSKLPEGAILYAPNIGAYTTASSSSFNGFEPATRIFLEAQSHLETEQQTEQRR